jgi:hypothetical protein
MDSPSLAVAAALSDQIIDDANSRYAFGNYLDARRREVVELGGDATPSRLAAPNRPALIVAEGFTTVG